MPKQIDFSCPKCTWIETTTVKWIEANDYLMCQCTHCGYEWRLEPADKEEAPVPPDDSDVKED